MWASLDVRHKLGSLYRTDSISSPLPAAAKATLGERFPLSPYRLSHGSCFKISWNAKQRNKTLILDLYKHPNSLWRCFYSSPAHLETVAVSSPASLFVLPSPATRVKLISFRNWLLWDRFHHLRVKFGSCESSSHSQFSWLIFSDKICSPFGH